MTLRTTCLAALAGLAASWLLWPTSLASHELVTTTVTFDREIVRILSKKCISCHSENNLGIALTSYEQTRPWARAIEEEVLRRHMPPWRALAGYGEFVNDIGMTGRELQFLVAWIEGNGPRTKDQTILSSFDVVTPVKDRLTLDGRWQLGKPDLLRKLPANAIAPGQGDQVRRVVVDTGLTVDRWIRGFEFQPGDRRVVRAVFFSSEETGQWLGSWTPWYGVTALPDDTAYLLPASSRIVAEIHYRSASQPVEDAGTLGIYFAQAPMAHVPTELAIEAVAQPQADPGRQKFSGMVTLPDDARVLALKPEVAPGVTSVEVSAQRPDGTVVVMLLVRDVLPEWPTPYIFAKPVSLPKGTKLTLTDYYDPSTATTPASVLRMSVSLTSAVRSAPAPAK